MKVLIMGKDGKELITLNRRKAIHLRCLNCACWHPQDVTNCNFTKCPLLPFRTGKEKQDSVLRNKAIRDYCLSCAHGQVGEVKKCPSRNCPLYIYRKGGVDKHTSSFEKVDPISETFRANITNFKAIYRFRKSA